MTFFRGSSVSGVERAPIESLRFARAHSGQGLGRAMTLDAVERARERGVVLVQLITDPRRANTRQVYQGLGSVASLHGLKLRLA
jgi:ribosomal protein S18 acetylase RimI-like enzyme